MKKKIDKYMTILEQVSDIIYEKLILNLYIIKNI